MNFEFKNTNKRYNINSSVNFDNDNISKNTKNYFGDFGWNEHKTNTNTNFQTNNYIKRNKDDSFGNFSNHSDKFNNNFNQNSKFPHQITSTSNNDIFYNNINHNSKSLNQMILLY